MEISIHAPREGCDEAAIAAPTAKQAISIHAPREGCDQSFLKWSESTSLFQSTHPARGATQQQEAN